MPRALFAHFKPLFVRLAWWFAPGIRHATNANARRIFNDDLNPRQLRRFSLAVIGSFYEFVFDVGRSLRATPEELASRIESIEGHEKYAAARSSKGGAILLTRTWARSSLASWRCGN